MPLLFRSFFFFFNDTATTEIYTLSLHDALPIYVSPVMVIPGPYTDRELAFQAEDVASALTYNASFDCNAAKVVRSEEHTSELQSPCNLVCRLLLEKKKKKIKQSCVRESG